LEGADAEATERHFSCMIWPNKKYSIIYADPAWTYRDKAHAGERGAEYQYVCMDIEAIKLLPVQDLAADDCILFLWVTFPLLQEGLDTIKAWGFEYKTLGFNWVKRNKKAKYSWFWGMGSWTRSNPEVCLIGVKGKPKRVSAAVHSVVDTQYEGHSKKPDEVRQRIVQLCGDLPRIELFARERVAGWDAWGNEIS
jgi:N6-adenosine-specific RNA methylase IME4